MKLIILILLITELLVVGCVHQARIQPPATAPTPVVEPAKPTMTGVGRYNKWFSDYTLLHFGNLVSPRWTKAVGMAESNLKYNAKSSVGALGLMQFMPATFSSVAPEPYKTLGSLDPESAIWVGCKYLRMIWKQFDVVESHERKAFVNAGYNSGPGNVMKARKKCLTIAGCNQDEWSMNVENSLVTLPQFQSETRGYVARIRKFEKQLAIAGEFL